MTALRGRLAAGGPAAEFGEVADGPHPYLRRVARQIAEENLFHIHDLDAVGDTPRRRDAPRYRPAHLVERLGPGQDIIIDDLFDLRPDLGNRRANGIGAGGKIGRASGREGVWQYV